MFYNDLTRDEQSCARVMFLNALNDMERDQARDAGKVPELYNMSSSLFKDMLLESEWDRYIDINGVKRIRLILV